MRQQNKKLFIGPLQQASMLSLPNFPTEKACNNKPYQNFNLQTISSQAAESFINGIWMEALTHYNPKNWSF